MTEQRFDELINLYLDNEIGRHELGDFKQAMQGNILRRRKFERACEVHQAARKALATRANQSMEAPDSSFAGATEAALPQSKTGSEPARPRRASSSSGPDSIRQKQVQAHRNASVGAMADRQANKGAATEVDLTRISVGSRRSAKHELSTGRFSFFNSPLGMIVGAGLAVVFAAGLYFFVKLAAPDNESDGSVGPGSSVVFQPDVRVDPKVMKELAADSSRKPAGTDAIHNQVYQAAVGGTPAPGAPGMNFFTTQTGAAPDDEAPTGGSATNGSLRGPTGASALPATTGMGPAGLPAPGVTGLPNSMGLPPGQDQLVRLSVPSLLPAMPNLDDQGKPANATSPPPVKLP